MCLLPAVNVRMRPAFYVSLNIYFVNRNVSFSRLWPEVSRGGSRGGATELRGSDGAGGDVRGRVRPCWARRLRAGSGVRARTVPAEQGRVWGEPGGCDGHGSALRRRGMRAVRCGAVSGLSPAFVFKSPPAAQLGGKRELVLVFFCFVFFLYFFFSFLKLCPH